MGMYISRHGKRGRFFISFNLVFSFFLGNDAEGRRWRPIQSPNNERKKKVKAKRGGGEMRLNLLILDLKDSML